MRVDIKSILWRDEMRNMVPWVQKIEHFNYALLLEYDGHFEYLIEIQTIDLMWYDYPQGSWHHENRISNSKQKRKQIVQFQTPKDALMLYLQFGWKIDLSNTNFGFNLDLECDERYCVLEIAKQWLELYQWDLQYQCKD